MRAVRVERLNGPASLRLVDDVPLPETGDRVVVDMVAAGVARSDLLRTRGQYQERTALPFTLGAEGAGIVRSSIPGSPFSVGQRVAVVTGTGAWQETVAVSPDDAFELPDGVAAHESAGLVMNLLTVHLALKRRARLQPGEVVLVHGAGGGIGTAALQLARISGAQVIAVLSTPGDTQRATAMGAEMVLTVEEFQAVARAKPAQLRVDVIVDPVGGERSVDSLRVLSPGGRLLVLGFSSGEIPSLRVNRLLLNNVSAVGVAWSAFGRSHPGFAQAQWCELSRHLESGDLRIPEYQSFPLGEAPAVLQDMEARRLERRAVLMF